MMRRRRESPELGWGRATQLDAGHDAVLAHRCDWEQSAVVAIHNLGATPLEVRVELGPTDGCDQVVALLDAGQTVHPVDGPTTQHKLARSAHPWFRLQATHGATHPYPGTRRPPGTDLP